MNVGADCQGRLFLSMDKQWVEGFISVEAALASPYRSVEAIYVKRPFSKRHLGRIRALRRLATSKHIRLSEVDETFFKQNASGVSHGGVMAQVGERQFLTLAQMMSEMNHPFIVMMDGVEDPFNFGQAIRSLFAAGVSGLVLPPRNWTSATATVGRASAGTSELMPIAVADSAEAAADFYQSQGLKVACMATEGAIDVYEADLTQPLFVLIGGEKRGITRSFLSRAELKLRIPYQRPFTYSLGTTSSAAVLAFERLRQLSG